MRMSRVWAMPDSETFNVPPIKDFVRRYLSESKVSIDPFARNKQWFTHTNDINPNTEAQHHLDAEEFLTLMANSGVVADLAIFDPPYSPRQLKECYNSFGRKMQLEDGQTARLIKRWREALLPCLSNDSIVLSFGWNSVGMGQSHGFELIELLLVCHGADHNDTICLAERRLPIQPQTTPLL